jgi:thiol:disulfide interchange protein
LVPAAYSDASPPSSSKVSGLLARLQGRTGNAAGEEEFLPVEKAFTVEVRSANAHTLVARLSPAESYYLYRDKIHFTIAPAEKVAIDSVQLPRGEIKLDPNFGKTEVFHTPVQAVMQLRRDSAGEIPVVLKKDCATPRQPGKFRWCSLRFRRRIRRRNPPLEQ